MRGLQDASSSLIYFALYWYSLPSFHSPLLSSSFVTNSMCQPTTWLRDIQLEESLVRGPVHSLILLKVLVPGRQQQELVLSPSILASPLLSSPLLSLRTSYLLLIMCSSYWGGFSRMAHGRRSSTPYGQPPLWYVYNRFLLHHFTFIFIHLFILLSFYLSFYLSFCFSFCYIIYFVFFLGAWAPPADDPLNIAPDESGVYHFTFTVFILFLFLFYSIIFISIQFIVTHKNI